MFLIGSLGRENDNLYLEAALRSSDAKPSHFRSPNSKYDSLVNIWLFDC